MQKDENTQDVQLEQQENEVVVEVEAENDNAETEKPAPVTLTPAEYRHFKKWQKGETQPQQINKVEDKVIPEDKIWEVAEYIREGYDRNEVDFIVKNGGKEALKDPNSLVSIALKARKEQKTAEEAAQQAKDGGYGGQIVGKVTLDQLKNMTPAEMAKHLPHAD